MTKKQFMDSLDAHLRQMDDKERAALLKDYEEHFAIGYERGESDEQIVAGLGDPRSIAEESLAGHYVEKARVDGGSSNILRAVVAVVSLSFFNLIFVLGPLLALAGVLVAGYATALGLALMPAAVIVTVALDYYSGNLWWELACSVACSGAGLILLAGMLYVGKWFLAGCLWYLRLNVRIISGRRI